MALNLIFGGKGRRDDRGFSGGKSDGLHTNLCQPAETSILIFDLNPDKAVDGSLSIYYGHITPIFDTSNDGTIET